jgi:hypothetical protein
MNQSDDNHGQHWHDRVHDQWYSGFLLGAGVMGIAFAALLIATLVL